jgi:hypothetical protein
MDLKMDGRDTAAIKRRAASAGTRVLLAFVCLVIAPIAAIWVAGQLPNPPGEGPGGLRLIFGIAVPSALALVAATVTGVGRREAVFWVLAALFATLGLLVLIAALVARID